ncbi:SipW-dependent-type signal peptide-containing protein [Natronorubrum sp. A-ect3]|uniref:SipW-dependent-type signal peptide-containing protein n=1 Tax=Natronorubrum sp. A-ect3 TaxID=3242698 RepID=UPI00359EBA5E
MTDEPNSISRRNVLAGLGTIGVGGALVGAGTSAYFSDEQQLPNELVAGELKLKLDWQQRYYGASQETRPQDYGGAGRPYVNAHPDHDKDGEQSIVVNDTEYRYDELGRNIGDDEIDYCADLDQDFYFGENQNSLIELDDIKPGDCGEITFSYHLCDNDGWIWFRTKNKDYPEPSEEPHLVDAIEAKVWYDVYENEDNGIEQGDNEHQEEKEPVIAQGSLRDVLEELNETNGGFLLEPDPLVDPDTNDENKIDDCVELETIDDDFEDVDDVQQYLRDLFASYQADGQDGESIELEGEGDDTIRIWITGLVYQDVGDDTSDVVGFDWKSNHGICQTRVKGGPGEPRGGEFTVEDCAFEGTSVAPFGAAQGTKRYGVSNFQFWYCEGIDEPKEPECFEASTTHYIGFEWCLPEGVGNEVQGDALEFDFGFYTEQCRHNDDPTPYWMEEESD